METAILKTIRMSPLIQKLCLILFIAMAISTISFLYVQRTGYDLKITLNILEFASLIIVVAWVVADEKLLQKILLVILISVLFVSASGILKSLGMNIPGGVRTTRSHFGPFLIGVTGMTFRGMSYSTLVLIAFPISVNKTIIKSNLVRWISGAIIILASIISYSRNLWVSLFIQAAILLFHYHAFVKNKASKVLVTSIIGMLLTFALLNVDKVFGFLYDIRPTTVHQRFEGYLSGIKLAAADPLSLFFGAGIEKFLVESEEDVVPHNMFIDLLLSKGILVVALIIVFIYILVNRLLKALHNSTSVDQRNYSMLFLVALSGYLVFSMFAPLFNSLTFWTVIAFSAAYISIGKHNISLVKRNHVNEGVLK
jgi:hypothetical protein